MPRTFKILLLATASFAAAGSLVPARAQSVDELRKEIQALQHRLDVIEAQQKKAASTAPATPAAVNAATAQNAAVAQKAAADAQAALVQVQQQAAASKQQAADAVAAALAPAPGKPADSFRVPGTNMTVRIYGQIKVNGVADLTSFNRSDNLTAQSIALGSTANHRTGGDTQISARRSRFGIEAWVPTGTDMFGDVHTVVEADFAGQQTDNTTQATSNAYTLRLRKAYGEFGNASSWGSLLLGQTDTLFSDNAILPIQWLSDWTFVGTDNVRQAQVRYTATFAPGGTFSVAVEDPYSDVTTEAGTSYPDNNGGGALAISNAPDITARMLYAQPWGTVAVRAVLRPQMELNNQAASALAARFTKTTAGYGLGATGVLNLLDGTLVLQASGNAGKGIGRYLDGTSAGLGAVSNLGLAGITPATTTLDGVTVFGGMIGATYYFTPMLRTNMALGGARLSYPGYTALFGGCVGGVTGTNCTALDKSEWAGSINLVWSPIKAVDLGLEYQHVERNLEHPVTGSLTTNGAVSRLQATGIVRF